VSRIPSATELQSANAGGEQAVTSQDVNLDDFFQLLLTELQNQDPLNPMDNSEVMNQIGQIREIGATNKLTDTLDAVLLGQNITTASSLIGKQISALSDTGDEVTGAVDRVTVDVDPEDDSTQILRVHVGEHTINLTNIREIVE
jgi:flagellar basal-body rod modification protein FlgD